MNLDFGGPFLHIRKRTGKIKLWLSEKLTEKRRASEPTVTLYFAMIVLLHFCQLHIRTLLCGQYKSPITLSKNRTTLIKTQWKTLFDLACKEGQFDVVELELNERFEV